MVIRFGSFNFNPTMKLGLIFLFWSIQITAAFAQATTIDGIVFDKDTKERIAKVNVINTSNKASIYDNLKAEFKLPAKVGDVLIFTKEGYFNDTLTIKNENSLAVYMKRTSIPLQPVYITGRFVSPQSQLEANKRLYNKAYGSLADHDLLSVNSNGAGLSIDALYNLISRQGRNATRLRETIDRDYHQNVIDERFNRTLVGSVTGLKDTVLTDFMFKYRPGYYFVIEATDYDFIKYIRNNYRHYQRNPTAYSLAPLYLDLGK